MRRKPIPLNALRAFEAAGRHESFTKAAEELGVSHAAVSRHVTGLEKRLEAALFERRGRHVVLTRKGARLLRAVTPAFAAIHDAIDAVAPPDGAALAVSAESLFAMKWLIPHLRDFYAAHPGVRVEVEASGRLVDVAGGECDVAIRHLWRPDEARDGDLICRSPAFPVARPDVAARCEPGRPDDLLQAPLLRDDDGQAWRRWFAAVGCPEAAPEPPVRLSGLLSIEAALAGEGVILATPELVSAELADGRLARIGRAEAPIGGYVLLIHGPARKRKAVQRFRRWLLDAFAEGARR
ncbi:MAG: LysR substrate-binding domain-containing protein [Alphaproteobacteria bacterium]|nr:LysR substrate-binding domain-containing protein [Alphaproteobacteria bacterium]